MSCRPTLPIALAIAMATFTVAAYSAEIVASAASVQTVSLSDAAIDGDTVTREDAFIYKLFEPKKPNGRALILMHGSGGNETTLVDLATKIAPNATLVGIRGRVVQNGVKRWYKRVTPTEFDQQDVRVEAAAFVKFISRIADENDLDLSTATFLGYSNGANLIAALTMLHPDFVHRAVLLRSMQVLAETPKVDLSDSRFLTIAGENDKLYYPFAPKLEALLRGSGANVDARVIQTGHGIGDEDARIVSEWLSASSN